VIPSCSSDGKFKKPRRNNTCEFYTEIQQFVKHKKCPVIAEPWCPEITKQKKIISLRPYKLSSLLAL
jgi:hypothetical protein